MIQLFVGDLADAVAELIIIPQATMGSLSRNFENIVAKIQLLDTVTKSELGEIKLQPLTGHPNWRYVAFACSVNDNTSSYTAIYQIIKNLAERLPNDVTSLAIPLLGSGAGNLDPDKVYYLLSKSLTELLPNVTSVIYTIDKELSYRIKVNKEPATNAIKLAFNYVVDDIVQVRWAIEMIRMDEFYFDLARSKFKEYLIWYSQDVDFNNLLQRFNDSNLVFSKFLETVDENTQDYRFFVLCGELVAYIDRHAYNKQIWNKYKDKRTMALSSVNQTRWIQNLINFRAKLNNYSFLPHSIRNAFIYLKQPAENLTMLSANHRAKVSKVLFGGVSESELIPAVGKYFGERHITCTNYDNNGALYSRILYAPDVKALWISDFDDQSDVNHPSIAKAIPKSDQSSQIQAQEENIIETVRRRNLKALMHSDAYASVDLLNYETYASIIARLITSNLSKPPFNISIMAPWGKGKTSLMRFIQKKINPNSIIGQEVKERPKSSIQTLLGWLNSPDAIFDNFKQLEYPVIWFNAWKFQKSEQIWAGLADEIIRQLAAQLNTIDQERFWLKLNLKRIDRDRLKKELLFKFIGKFLIPFLCILIGLAFFWVFKHIPWKDVLNQFIPVVPWLMNSIPIVAGIAIAFHKISREYKKPPELEVGKFVLQPEYRQKMGFLQAVEDDLRQAIQIVIKPDRPAVIFIDDLDRCSPTVIADVVEAINAFMSGDLSNCYFIIGQDPQMITASLDAAYEKIAGKIGKLESQQSSIGRFFLEKFSQLTISIPVLNKDQKQNFIKTLLATIDLENIPADQQQYALLEEYQKMEKELDTLADPEDIYSAEKEVIERQISLFNPEAIANFQEKILGNAFKNYQIDDNELENLIIDVAEYLDSPRTIKRFLNLFLFYHFFRFTIPGRRISEVEEGTLAKWLVLMVRWPQLVQAVQWDTEKGFVGGTNAGERAKGFDDLINRSENYTAYKELLKNETTAESLWMADPELFEICKSAKSAIKLNEIVHAGIW